jgi:hypothetical protein
MSKLKYHPIPLNRAVGEGECKNLEFSKKNELKEYSFLG